VTGQSRNTVLGAYTGMGRGFV